MATRSNILVQGGKLSVMLYRHWDGYPAETGGHIVETLKDRALTGDLSRRFPDDCAASLVNALLRTHQNAGEPFGVQFSYEITTGLHGDIDHLYRIRFPNAGAVEIGHSRVVRDGAELSDAQMLAGLSKHTLAEFVSFVNADRSACNARIHAHDDGAETYPLLAV